MLIEGLFGVSSAHALADPLRDYPEKELVAALERRALHEPLQYISGKAYFCNETYIVNKNCLIPRADTELLVTEGARLLPEGGRFADLFCGSGCVGISLAAMRGDATGVSVDISPAALELTKKNAELNCVMPRLTFICGDVTRAPLGEEIFDLITANPPYITGEEMRELQPEVCFEPELALYGGEDGLDLYRGMLSACKNNLSPDGYLLCEIGWKQGDAALCAAKAAGFDGEILRDLAGRDRAAKLRLTRQ